MMEKVLTSIGGVGAYGVISICIFIALFALVTIWMLCLKKPYLQTMRSLPLEDDEVSKSESEKNINPKNP
jgi:cytochrome c oxidase cbb3-type subunit IV